MNSILHHSVFLPKIAESREDLDRITKAYQIKHQILTEILKNDVASLYSINGQKYASEHTVRKVIGSKCHRKVVGAENKAGIPSKKVSKAQHEDLSRRHSICISELSSIDCPSFVVKKINHNNDPTCLKQSLQKIRNGLKLKLLRFKTEMSYEDKQQRNQKEQTDFGQIFSIRSISKSLKAKHALQYRLQAKKFFRPQPIRVAVVSQKQPIYNPRVNDLRTSAINGWIIEEQDINLSNNMNTSSNGHHSPQ